MAYPPARQPWLPSIHDYDLEEQDPALSRNRRGLDYRRPHLPYRTRPGSYDLEGQCKSTGVKPHYRQKYASLTPKDEPNDSAGSNESWRIPAPYVREPCARSPPSYANNDTAWDRLSSRYVNNSDAWEEKKRAQERWARRHETKAAFRLGVSESDESDDGAKPELSPRIEETRYKFHESMQQAAEDGRRDADTIARRKERSENDLKAAAIRNGMDPNDQGDLELLRLYREQKRNIKRRDDAPNEDESAREVKSDNQPPFNLEDWHVVLSEEYEETSPPEDDGWTMLERD